MLSDGGVGCGDDGGGDGCVVVSHGLVVSSRIVVGCACVVSHAVWSHVVPVVLAVHIERGYGVVVSSCLFVGFLLGLCERNAAAFAADTHARVRTAALTIIISNPGAKSVN